MKKEPVAGVALGLESGSIPESDKKVAAKQGEKKDVKGHPNLFVVTNLLGFELETGHLPYDRLPCRASENVRNLN